MNETRNRTNTVQRATVWPAVDKTNDSDTGKPLARLVGATISSRVGGPLGVGFLGRGGRGHLAWVKWGPACSGMFVASHGRWHVKSTEHSCNSGTRLHKLSSFFGMEAKGLSQTEVCAWILVKNPSLRPMHPRWLVPLDATNAVPWSGDGPRLERFDVDSSVFSS